MVTTKKGNDVEFFSHLGHPLKWHFKEYILPQNAKTSMDGSMLTIMNVQFHNEGYYESSGQDVSGYTIFTRGKLIVTGEYKPHGMTFI